jgi:hydrogenase nickel incorporation protein HypA/HybF
VHEVSLVEALLDQADRAIAPRAAGTVRLVTVRIGALAGVDTELFRTAFEGCKGDRGYGAAALEILDEPAAWRCDACGGPVAAGGPLRCAACDGIARLAAGGDLILQRLELEEVSDV